MTIIFIPIICKKPKNASKEANTKMLGPNGERLEIVLKDANEVSSFEYQHNILIITSSESIWCDLYLLSL